MELPPAYQPPTANTSSLVLRFTSEIYTRPLRVSSRHFRKSMRDIGSSEFQSSSPFIPHCSCQLKGAGNQSSSRVGRREKNKEVRLRIREIHGRSVPMCIIYERDPLAVKTKLLLDLTEVGFCYLPTPESDLEAARPPSF